MTVSTASNIYFLGIGGIGMSGLALLARQLGYPIAGSDKSASAMTQMLVQSGVDISIGHDNMKLNHADVVVHSSALSVSHPVIRYAQEKNKIILKRAEFLAQLLPCFDNTIAVTGTHGKTTITAMIAHVLSVCAYLPSYLVGGIINSLQSHAQLQNTKYFVFEADESDGSFCYYDPSHVVIANIDHDHMETYAHDFNALLESLGEFAQRAKVAYVCTDDLGCQRLLECVAHPCMRRYGIEQAGDFQATNILYHADRTDFDVVYGDKVLAHFSLPMAGKHSVLNALATIAVCYDLGVEIHAIATALTTYQGVKRRFDCYRAQENGVAFTLIDDYGHHPAEVKATILAVRQRFPHQRCIHVFQPHRYTRIRDLFNEWVDVLSLADEVVLMPTYAAGERVIVGAESDDLYRVLANKGIVVSLAQDHSDAYQRVTEMITHNDVVLLQGAGDVTQLVGYFKHEK